VGSDWPALRSPQLTEVLEQLFFLCLTEPWVRNGNATMPLVAAKGHSCITQRVKGDAASLA
jgi:hypothetical protein